MKRSIFVTIAILVLSCSQEPVSIDYGNDGCQFCKMTIVDPKFGAEIITTKGKVFKFDALECLVNYNAQNPGQDGDRFYATDYLSGNWLKVEDAFYLRSRSIPSPMGQYLTTLSSFEEAEKLQKSNRGIIQSWKELNNNFQISNIEN